MQKPYIVILGVSLFFATLFVIDTIHQYDQVEPTYTRAIDLLAVQVPPPWEIKPPEPEELEIMN